MKYKIVVEITGRTGLKYAPLVAWPGRTAGRLDLTTIFPDQTEAAARLFLDRGRGLIHLIDLDIAGIEWGEKPVIRLYGKLEGDANLSLRVDVNGTQRVAAACPLGKHVRGFRKVVLAAAAAAVALVCALFIVLGASGRVGAAPTFESTGRAGPAEAPRQAPAPPRAGAGEAPVAAYPGREEPARAASSAEKAVAKATLSERATVVLFAPEEAALSAEAMRQLDALHAGRLSGNRDLRVVISGHCALFGGESGRTWISSRRAEAVSAYLRSIGWRPAWEPELRGLGAAQPLSRDPGRQRENRRVEIDIGARP